MADMRAILAGCDVDRTTGAIQACRRGQERAFARQVLLLTPGRALDTMNHALHSDDAALRTLAAGLLYKHFGSRMAFLSSEPVKVDRRTAAGLVAALEQIRTPVAEQMASTVVHAAMIAGLDSELLRVLAAHPQPRVRLEAYGELMIFGRLRVFDTVQRLAQSGDPRVVAAALRAPRRMPSPTAAEKARFCPWGQSFLTRPEPQVADQAWRLMIRCGGAYIDALLAEGQRRMESADLTPALVEALARICFKPSRWSKLSATPAQCRRNYALLQRVTDARTLPVETRGMALWAIYHQRRDAETLKLMRSYQRHPEPEIRARARQAIRELTTTYKLK
jgi:hypothetical protein